MSSFRYSNKRMGARSSGGQFLKMTGADFGIGGVCTCGHFKLHHYNGDPRDTCPDPRKFVYRCFTCEPKTDAELALDAEVESSKPKPVSIMDILKESA